MFPRSFLWSSCEGEGKSGKHSLFGATALRALGTSAPGALGAAGEASHLGLVLFQVALLGGGERSLGCLSFNYENYENYTRVEILRMVRRWSAKRSHHQRVGEGL